MPMPTISIVTPSFQHGPYIEATIRSVLEQDYPCEYWVMDGGSTDETGSVLEKYRHKLRYVSEKDKGQTNAINKGFSQTTGQILGWLNSDDTLALGALTTVAKIFADNPGVGVVYGNADFIDYSGKFIAPCAHIEPFNRHRLLYYSDFIVQPAAFFRRSVYDAVGGLDESLHWAMDYDFWLKASAITDFHYLPQTLAFYRWLGTSKTGMGGQPRLREVAAVLSRQGIQSLPAYFRLEAVRMHLAEGIAQAKKFRIDRALTESVLAAWNLLSSPRAMRSAMSAQTWKIILTGQKLRNAPSPQHS